MNRRWTLWIILSACFSLSTTLAFATPNNASLLKKEIHQYHESGEYDKEVKDQIDAAQRFLLEQVSYYKAHKINKKLAIVLDIDETSLSNYDKIKARDFSGDPEKIHQEILAANAPAIKATLSLYQLARRHSVAVFFVTGRVPSELQATKKNLAAAGFSDWAGIYVRPQNYSKASIVPYKAACRAKIEAQGYLIVETIGDQDSDLLGGHALKGFKLPNPFYHIS